jgi:hypothetical protein
MITEEKPGATGTNETDEHMKFKVPENYPLRKPKAHAEVLLVSYSDAKAILEQKIGFKCDEGFMEESGLSMIKKRINEVEDKGREFYKYIMVDLDDVTIIIERFGRAIKKLLIDHKIDIKEVKMYAFSSTSSEKIIDHCRKGGFTFYIKPSKSEALDVFRHMANEETPEV